MGLDFPIENYAKKVHPPKSNGYQCSRFLEESDHACTVFFLFFMLVHCFKQIKLYKQHKLRIFFLHVFVIIIL